MYPTSMMYRVIGSACLEMMLSRCVISEMVMGSGWGWGWCCYCCWRLHLRLHSPLLVCMLLLPPIVVMREVDSSYESIAMLMLMRVSISVRPLSAPRMDPMLFRHRVVDSSMNQTSHPIRIDRRHHDYCRCYWRHSIHSGSNEEQPKRRRMRVNHSQHPSVSH